MAVTNLLPNNLFPASIHGLLHTISRAGFFDRSVMIGSWVMLIYQRLYGARYALRTMDIDFAVHIAHAQRRLRADLTLLITGLKEQRDTSRISRTAIGAGFTFRQSGIMRNKR